VPQRGRRNFGERFLPIGLNGVFETEMYSTCVGKIDSNSIRTTILSLETPVRWLSGDIVSFEIEGAVYEKFAKKSNSDFNILLSQAASIAAANYMCSEYCEYRTVILVICAARRSIYPSVITHLALAYDI